jgi:glycosyltransferase involved in cell wall biosynthesis
MLGGQQPDVVKEISTYTAASGHRDLIHMVGPVAREDLPHWLNRAHVFAAPSLYEGGPGFVYLEAMACGLPVIGTSGSGIEEVVVPGVNGLLVPPGDDAVLAEALLTLLQDPERTLRMGRQAREYVLAEAETEACVGRLEAFYLTVMQKSHDAGHPP